MIAKSKNNMNVSFSQDAKRSLTHSLDGCYVGFYFWLGSFTLRIGGIDLTGANTTYPYIVPTFIGFGYVLPNYISWHTPFSKFKKLTDKNKSADLMDIAA